MSGFPDAFSGARERPFVKIKPIREGARLPVYSSAEAAGADLHAVVASEVAIHPGNWALVPCGFAMEIPKGYEAQVRPRSGIAAKYGVTVLNSPGTIDSDYRGEVMVMLINHGPNSFLVNTGDRIAQMVIAPVSCARIEWTGERLSETVRGEGGFGSTGK